jgi:hypothetical protein
MISWPCDHKEAKRQGSTPLQPLNAGTNGMCVDGRGPRGVFMWQGVVQLLAVQLELMSC